MYLAIGIIHESGFSWSIQTDSVSKDTVKEALANASNGNGPPDEILLVQNGEISPNVIRHW